MGLNYSEEERPASLGEYLMTRPSPDHLSVDISTIDYLKLVEDEQANISALLSIIKAYERVFEEEDLVEGMIGPYLETDPNIPKHLLAWFDRTNLEKMISGAISVINMDIRPETVHSAALLVASFYNHTKHDWETYLGMVVDLEIACGGVQRSLDVFASETKEPEILEEKTELKKLLEVYRSCSDVAQQKVAEKKSQLILALQAQKYLSSLVLR